MVKELACVAIWVGLVGVGLDALNIRVSTYRFACYLMACLGVWPFLWLTHAVVALCCVGLLTLASAVGLWRWKFEPVEPQQVGWAAFRVRRRRLRRFVERLRPRLTVRRTGTRLGVRAR